jgi:dihydropteroate synthase
MSAQAKLPQTSSTLNCGGRILDLSKPIVMGIINCTPDSFYEGSRTIHNYLQKMEKMSGDGATIIDIGGQSTRPGAARISETEEWQRIAPVLEAIHQFSDEVFFSCDTFYATVAKHALDAGVHIINDISFGRIDPAILDVVAAYKAPYILMHMQGEPQTMQVCPQYSDVVYDVFRFFTDALASLNQKGIYDVIIDPGFGFGKTMEHNYVLLKHLPLFRQLDKPILAGLSRKSMINRVLNTKPVDALNGTTALNMLALQQGASVLRVHDVKEAVETIKLYDTFTSAV